MKKILLILAVFVAFQANAQYKNDQSMKVDLGEEQFIHPANPAKAHPKSKVRGTRTYSYISALDAVHYGGAGVILASANSSALPIWQDSTILTRYSSGYSATNFNSVAAVLSPWAPIYHNSGVYGSEMAIGPNDAYQLDTIVLWGFYMTPNSMGATAGDKLTISVVTSAQGQIGTREREAAAGNNVQTGYLDPVGTADTKIQGLVPFSDSVARIAGENAGSRTSWDYNFTNADTSQPTSPTSPSYFWKRFAFAPPGGPIQIPAGSRAAVSFTFKTNTGNWTPNVDSMSFYPGGGSVNHFRPRFFEESPGGRIPYRDYSENDGGDVNGQFKGPDFNNSSLMFTTSSQGAYDAAVRIEDFNQATFPYEQLDVDWIVTCNACLNNTSTDDLVLNNINVYPNPASDKLNIQLDEVKTDDVDVTVYSMTGKKLASEVVAQGSTRVSIDIAELATGIYLCEMEMNGIKNTVKITKK